jgi:hypothetical protein
MRVVHLNCDATGEFARMLVESQKAAEDVPDRARNEEVFLGKPEIAAGIRSV